MRVTICRDIKLKRQFAPPTDVDEEEKTTWSSLLANWFAFGRMATLPHSERTNVQALRKSLPISIKDTAPEPPNYCNLILTAFSLAAVFLLQQDEAEIAAIKNNWMMI